MLNSSVYRILQNEWYLRVVSALTSFFRVSILHFFVTELVYNLARKIFRVLSDKIKKEFCRKLVLANWLGVVVSNCFAVIEHTKEIQFGVLQNNKYKTTEVIKLSVKGR